MIGEPVGNNLKNRGADVVRIKDALGRLDYLQDEEKNEYLIRDLHNAVRKYQQDRGLRVVR